MGESGQDVRVRSGSVPRRAKARALSAAVGAGQGWNGNSLPCGRHSPRAPRRVEAAALQFFDEPEHMRRFEQEVRAISALSHPNIVAVHDTGETEQGRFIVMELVAGRTFRALASERPPLAVLVHLIRQVAQALAAAHGAGIVHRDIKPENLMARDDGYAKVLDFGLARLMPAGAQNAERRSPCELIAACCSGRCTTCRPSKCGAKRSRVATDIFSLGTVFYELVTGQHPFAADSQFGVLHRILSHAPLSPERLNPEIPERAGSGDAENGRKGRTPATQRAEVASALEARVDGRASGVGGATAVEQRRPGLGSGGGEPVFRERDAAEGQLRRASLPGDARTRARTGSAFRRSSSLVRIHELADTGCGLFK